MVLEDSMPANCSCCNGLPGWFRRRGLADRSPRFVDPDETESRCLEICRNCLPW